MRLLRFARNDTFPPRGRGLRGTGGQDKSTAAKPPSPSPLAGRAGVGSNENHSRKTELLRRIPMASDRDKVI